MGVMADEQRLLSVVTTKKGLLRPLVIVLALALLGLLIYGNYRHQSAQTTQPTASASPTQFKTDPASVSAQEKLDWKSFHSDEEGFSFQYPAQLKLEEKDGQVTLSSEDSPGIKLTFSTGTFSAKSLLIFVEQNSSQVRPMTIDGHSGWAFDTKDKTKSYIYLPKGSNGYLEILDETPAGNADLGTLAIKILSTIRMD